MKLWCLFNRHDVRYWGLPHFDPIWNKRVEQGECYACKCIITRVTRISL